ncbi:tol-pal system protein YbgF [Ferrimonas senticii]|uniref:tol-pal system protein YbgF n=1 Tax=Ferrimonas senticii TaxID=394566 RepID=UPI0004239BBD|nr:tol-pal system protein YbgF [Ferrimonas senticii]
MNKAVMAATLLGLSAGALAQAPVVDANAPGVAVATTGIASTSLESRVARLEQLLRANSQSTLRLEQMLEQLQRENGELRGLTETQTYQIEQMTERQRQLYQQIAKLQSAPKVVAQPVVTAPVTQPTAGAAAVVSLSETDAYNAALNLATKERRFDDAVPAFRDFIAKYPQSNLTPNAYYWLGQVLFTQGQFAEADKMFANLVGNYPNSGKRADSLYKQGLIAKQQGDAAAAKLHFTKVIEQYPGSTSAKLAQKQL